jgi:FMN hydrolase / 5-amino-6-(5-phospho-D-ribitylamino)uracil phosphatase
MSERIVLLDVMGTLVHDPFFVEVPRFFGMTLDELIALKHPTAWVEFELGEIDEATLGRRFFADEREFDLEGLKQAMRSAYRPLDGVESLLDELVRSGAALHAFSNYPQWYRMVEEAVCLSRWLQWSFVSCRIGARKPSAAAYRAVLEKLGCRPEALVFVDDREDNCEGARRLGIEAVRFTDVPTLRRRLATLGVL